MVEAVTPSFDGDEEVIGQSLSSIFFLTCRSHLQS